MGTSNSNLNPHGLNIKFLKAIKIGNFQLAQEFVELGADVEARDKEGNCALSLAVTNGNRVIVDWLVKQKKVKLNSKNNDGCTPLMYAASVGHLDILKYLIENGCPLEDENIDKFTALHWAAYIGNKDTVKTLLHFGANTKALNVDGKRPIDLAETSEVKSLLTDICHHI